MFLKAGIFLCALLATEGSAQELDITSFKPCTHESYGYTQSGLTCGLSSDPDLCWPNDAWCHENSYRRCYTGPESERISTRDSRLCSNPEVWREVDCNVFKNGRVERYGMRCTGQKMECIYPWYTVENIERRIGLVTSCTDHSDQIFEVNQTCRQHLQKHLDFHTKNFCNENNTDVYLEVQSSLICTNSTEWLSGQDSSITDTHNCQSSCNEQGPDCLACTNSSYFLCDQSDQCIHPSLVCDGHPHCLDRSDEDQCQNNSKSNLVLDVSSALVFLLFIGLTVN